MAIQITSDEVLAFNVQNNAVLNAQAELQRAISAKNALLALLEVKYNAKFNPATGQLEEKPKEKKDK